MGEKYRKEVLAHGGGKHPTELVEGIPLYIMSMMKSTFGSQRGQNVD